MARKKTKQAARKTGGGDQREVIADLEHQNAKLSSLLSVSQEMMKEMHLDNLLGLIMDRVTVVMDAERSTLFLLDRKKDELYAKVAQGAGADTIRFPNGRGIAGHVGKTGATINLQDAYDDKRFNPGFDKQTGFRTKAMLCMPIRNTRNEIIGVTQVLNKKHGDHYFTKEDESLLAAFSSIAAISLENSFVYEEINRTMHTFEKFVPMRYIESMAKEGLESIMLGNAEEVAVTVLFSDIRGFTDLSEKMTADEVLKFLNSYLRRMSDIIAKQHGFIDKFIGDAIMAIFDAKASNNAVDASIEMMRALPSFNRKRKQSGYEAIHIGIGLHHGPAVIGTVGSNDRMDSTILGDTVNLAARMEGLTKMYGCPLMITESTLKKLRNRKQYSVREVDTVMVKGKAEPVKIFDVFDWETPPRREKKEQTRPHLEKGRRHYKKRKWDQALKEFRAGHALAPRDQVFKIYIQRCEEYSASPELLPSDWDGATRLFSK